VFCLSSALCARATKGRAKGCERLRKAQCTAWQPFASFRILSTARACVQHSCTFTAEKKVGVGNAGLGEARLRGCMRIGILSPSLTLLHFVSSLPFSLPPSFPPSLLPFLSLAITIPCPLALSLLLALAVSPPRGLSLSLSLSRARALSLSLSLSLPLSLSLSGAGRLIRQRE
jgi:hypothetical protein